MRMRVFKSFCILGIVLCAMAQGSYEEFDNDNNATASRASDESLKDAFRSLESIVPDLHYMDLERIKETPTAGFICNHHRAFQGILLNVPDHLRSKTLYSFLLHDFKGEMTTDYAKSLVTFFAECARRNQKKYRYTDPAEILEKLGGSRAKLSLLVKYDDWFRVLKCFEVIDAADVSETCLQALSDSMDKEARFRPLILFPLIYYGKQSEVIKPVMPYHYEFGCFIDRHVLKASHLQRVFPILEMVGVSLVERLDFAEKLYCCSPKCMRSLKNSLEQTQKSDRQKFLTEALRVSLYFDTIWKESRKHKISLDVKLMSGISKCFEGLNCEDVFQPEYVSMIFDALAVKPQELVSSLRALVGVKYIKPKAVYLALRYYQTKRHLSYINNDSMGLNILNLSTDQAAFLYDEYLKAGSDEERAEILEICSSNFGLINLSYNGQYDFYDMPRHRAAKAFIDRGDGVNIPRALLSFKGTCDDTLVDLIKATEFCSADSIMMLYESDAFRAIKDKPRFLAQLREVISSFQGGSGAFRFFSDLLWFFKGLQPEVVEQTMDEVVKLSKIEGITPRFVTDFFKVYRQSGYTLGDIRFANQFLAGNNDDPDREDYIEEYDRLRTKILAREDLLERESRVFAKCEDIGERLIHLELLLDHYKESDESIRSLYLAKNTLPKQWHPYISFEQVRKLSKWSWVFEATDLELGARGAESLIKVLEDFNTSGAYLRPDTWQQMHQDPLSTLFILKCLALIDERHHPIVTGYLVNISASIVDEISDEFYHVMSEREDVHKLVAAMAAYANTNNRLRSDHCIDILMYWLLTAENNLRSYNPDEEFCNISDFKKPKDFLLAHWENLICSEKPHTSALVARTVLKGAEDLKLEEDSHLVKLAKAKVRKMLLEDLQSPDIKRVKAALSLYNEISDYFQLDELPEDLNDLTDEQTQDLILEQRVELAFDAVDYEDEPINPYKLYEFLKRKRLEEVNLEKVKVHQVTLNVGQADESFVLCPETLKRAQAKQVFVKDLPDYGANFMSVMANHFEERFKDLKTREDIYSHLDTMSEAAYDLRSSVSCLLENAKTDSVLISYLLEGKKAPEKVVERRAAKFICFMAYIQGLSGEPSYKIPGTDTTLSEKEMAYLNMLVTIPFCQGRKDEGIENAYNLLPLEKRLSGLRRYETAAERVLESIVYPSVVKSLEGPLSADGQLIKTLAGQSEKGLRNLKDHAVHYQRYARNILGHILPLNHEIEFDSHTGHCLPDDIVDLKLQDLLNTFFESYSLDVLLKVVAAAVTEDVKREDSTTFSDVSQMLEGHIQLDQAWDENSNMTPAGTAHLLKVAGLVKKM